MSHWELVPTAVLPQSSIPMVGSADSTHPTKTVSYTMSSIAMVGSADSTHPTRAFSYTFSDNDGIEPATGREFVPVPGCLSASGRL